jgi:hypothetical protein
MRECYIFGLHILLLASHTPPAFVQSASVFAFRHIRRENGSGKGARKTQGNNHRDELIHVHLLLKSHRSSVALKNLSF